MYLASYYSWSQIRETPHKPHHKFIEFDDVRAAEAALRALNRTDIAGKRIKLEPSLPHWLTLTAALLPLFPSSARAGPLNSG